MNKWGIEAGYEGYQSYGYDTDSNTLHMNFNTLTSNEIIDGSKVFVEDAVDFVEGTSDTTTAEGASNQIECSSLTSTTGNIIGTTEKTVDSGLYEADACFLNTDGSWKENYQFINTNHWRDNFIFHSTLFKAFSEFSVEDQNGYVENSHDHIDTEPTLLETLSSSCPGSNNKYISEGSTWRDAGRRHPLQDWPLGYYKSTFLKVQCKGFYKNLASQTTPSQIYDWVNSERWNDPQRTPLWDKTVGSMDGQCSQCSDILSSDEDEFRGATREECMRTVWRRPPKNGAMTHAIRDTHAITNQNGDVVEFVFKQTLE